MPYIMKTFILLPVFYYVAGSNFHRLWKGGLIGVGVVLVSDAIGHRLSLYQYQNAIIVIGGVYPLFHLVNMFIFTMLYLNWLPPEWMKRILYTVYISVMFLAVEAVMFQANAIVYLYWKLWYSYFLDIAGLLLVAYLHDFLVARKAVA